MLRGLLKRLTDRLSPAIDKITSSPFVLRYLPALADPDLWHLNRHSAARAVAIGLFCGLIPGPLQALGSILLCMALRANVPLAVATTFYTNPLTIVPLYVVAYEYGRLFFPEELSLTTLETGGPGYALGTRQGVVKRVNPEVLGNRDAWEVIRLADGDQVVGALELRTGEEELCFVTSDAQLLHFPASGVRPQGRSGGGIAGVRVAAGHRAVWFGALDVNADNLVVTVAGSSDALPGTEAGTVKVTSFAEYPGKGRGTGGVRCHRFLKGEDVLLVAYAGPAPVKAAASSGAPVDLPEEHGRRDGSGTPAAQPILAISGAPR